MFTTRVLVIGGCGFFGRRLVERLATQPNLQIIVAGRSAQAAQALVARLQAFVAASLQTAVLDADSADLARQVAGLQPSVVVNASGPFQGADYAVAMACIQAGVHYLDLADGREFVAGIARLNAEAAGAGVLVTSGASSVPALSSAVVDHLALGLTKLSAIELGISPGNRTERGLATMQAVLSYCGKPLPAAGDQSAIVGWQGAHRHTYAEPVGLRLLSPCDVPDCTLLPPRYSGHPVVTFGAGLELEFLHRGMNLMAWMAKVGMVRDWAAHARWLKRAADLFQTWGTDAGAMHVTVQGITPQGHSARRTWQLIACGGDGPFVPTLAASALVRKIATGAPLPRGALPCIGLLTLADFQREMAGLQIAISQTIDP